MKKLLSTVSTSALALCLMLQVAHGMSDEGGEYKAELDLTPIKKRKAAGNADKIESIKRPKTSDLILENFNPDSNASERPLDIRLSGNVFPNCQIYMNEDIIYFFLMNLDSNSRKNLSKVNFQFSEKVRNYTHHLKLASSCISCSDSSPDESKFTSGLKERFPNLTSLNLSSLKLSVILDVLKAPLHLKKLAVNNIIENSTLIQHHTFYPPFGQNQFPPIYPFLGQNQSPPLHTEIQLPTSLTDLNLANNELFGDELVMPLTNLTNLTNLNLSHNNVITDKTLDLLSDLTILNLSFNKKITDTSLANSKNLTNLDLSYNELISDKSMMQLTNLKNLNLEENKRITDSALMQLINLTNLNLSSNYLISENSVNHLINIKELSLYGNYRIKDATIKHLINLTALHLDYKKITFSSLHCLPNLWHVATKEGCNIRDILTILNLKKLSVGNEAKGITKLISVLLDLITTTEKSTIDNKIHDEAKNIECAYRRLLIQPTEKYVQDYDFKGNGWSSLDENALRERFIKVSKASTAKLYDKINSILQSIYAELYIEGIYDKFYLYTKQMSHKLFKLTFDDSKILEFFDE